MRFLIVLALGACGERNDPPPPPSPEPVVAPKLVPVAAPTTPAVGLGWCATYVELASQIDRCTSLGPVREDVRTKYQDILAHWESLEIFADLATLREAEVTSRCRKLAEALEINFARLCPAEIESRLAVTWPSVEVPASCIELLAKIDTTVCAPSYEARAEAMAAGMRAVFPKLQDALANSGTLDLLCAADLKVFARNCAGRK